MLERRLILKMPVNITNRQHALQHIYSLSQKPKGAYVCVSNVHMCMETYDDPDFEEIVKNADIVLPDGKPISWAQKLLGCNNAEQVRGQDIVNELCKLSAESGIKIGLYGGSSSQLIDSVKYNLQTAHKGLKIAYAYSPPFRPLTVNENELVEKEIHKSQIDILFVGIGCPKQEKWMADHKDNLSCVMLGVGAVFDFISGEKKHAPRWIQSIGMEWFFRLMSEPKRLFFRYFKTNPRFVLLFTLQLLKSKFGRSNV